MCRSRLNRRSASYSGHYIAVIAVLSRVTVDVKIQRAMSRALATADDVNTAGNQTSRLVERVGHVTAEWVTWLDRAAAAQAAVGEMTSRAEVTSSRAREMLDILVDFDARSQGARSRRRCVGEST